MTTSPARTSPLRPALCLLACVLLSVLPRPTPVAAQHIHPAPRPFTLNSYDAIQAVWMIRRAGLLMHHPQGQHRGQILAIRHPLDVRAVPAGTDENAPGEHHRERWDITIDDTPLDWPNTFIRYGGRMVNLQALFTYRNQEVPPELRLRLQTGE